MHIDVANPTVHFKMARQLMKKNTFYFGADGQFGTLTAVGGTMGFYAGNVNIEAFYMKGFGKETVYWNSTGNDTEGAAHWAEEELEVKTVAGGKFGYGFILGTRFRVTPKSVALMWACRGTKRLRCMPYRVRLGCALKRPVRRISASA